jgi:hypothetical protein
VATAPRSDLNLHADGSAQLDDGVKAFTSTVTWRLNLRATATGNFQTTATIGGETSLLANQLVRSITGR